MAVPTKTETRNNLYTSTWQARKKKIENAWMNSNPVFYLLSSKGKVENQKGGRYIELPLEYSENSTFTAIGRGGTVSLDAQEILTTAFYEWRYYAINVTRFHTDDQKNSGEPQIFKRVDKELKNAKNTIIENLETQIFTAQAGLHINGFPDFFDTTPATGTVGGLNRATYDWWRNQTKDGSGRAFSTYGRRDLTNAFNTVIANGGKPSLLVSDQTVYELYDEEVFEIQRGYIDDKGMKDIGQGEFVFKGVPWTWSRSATAATINIIDMDKFYLIRDPSEWFKMTRWKDIPNQPEDYVTQILMTLNLCCSNLKHQNVYHTISE